MYVTYKHVTSQAIAAEDLYTGNHFGAEVDIQNIFFIRRFMIAQMTSDLLQDSFSALSREMPNFNPSLFLEGEHQIQAII